MSGVREVREQATPPEPERNPDSSRELEECVRTNSGDTSHSEINRQRGTSGMERILDKRVEIGLMRSRPLPANDPETRPTCPGGGKSFLRHPLKTNQTLSQNRIQ